MTKRKVKLLLKDVTKWFLAVVLIAIFIASIVFINIKWTEHDQKQKEVTYDAVIITNDSHYQLFQTDDVQEYLDFLENFDETKYEIIDISTSMFTGDHKDDEFYMVTYRTI